MGKIPLQTNKGVEAPENPAKLKIKEIQTC